MNTDRKKQILEILLKEKEINVKDLAKRLYISEPSVRRDLAELEKEKFLRRTHGGAVLEELNSSSLKIPFIIRELEQSDAKIHIARQAAELVKDGDVIMLDASSSAYNVIPFLSTRTNLTVITSGVKTLMRLAEYGINAYSTGGHLLPSCLSLTDHDATSMLAHYNADIVFFSCRGLSADGLLTDFSIEENHIRSKMLQNARTSVLLCNSKKINQKYIHTLCSIEDVDYCFSDVELPKNLLGRRQRENDLG